MVVVDSMRIAVHGKRYSLLTIKMCTRWIRKHPATVGFLCILVFLYRSFPFCFSVLVSASPVLVCTAVLLGTLLSFGEPYIPEIDEVVVRGDDDDSSVGCDDLMSEKLEKGSEYGDGDVKVDEKAREIQFAEQVEKVFTELEMKLRKREESEKKAVVSKNDDDDDDGDGVGSSSKYFEIRDSRDDGGSNGGGLESDGDGIKSVREFLAARTAECGGNEEEDEEEEEEEDGDSDDSGSDRAESSSPDASMADIMPILDELHPLLDEEAPQQQGGLISHYGSASEGSHHNRGSSDDDDDDGDDDSEEDDGKHEKDDEEEEGQESEGAQTGKEDESKSAIKWTEDDQKNLMDLGTSELERNQRLESLIARRRARRSSRTLIAKERNLIDFDGDLHFNVSPISTARRNNNPFDLPYDDDAPGSAPSSMMFLRRRNPFDLPYDSGEEKPDLKDGDSSDPEFPASFQHGNREPVVPVFRRHESFNVGPSSLGAPHRQERQQDLRWKPYFVTERFANEPIFHRQLSEISESKMSSIADNESVVSKHDDHHHHHETESSELIANVDTSSVLVEHGSLTSEGLLDDDALDSESVHHEEADVVVPGGMENNHDTDSCLSPSGSIVPVHINTSEILLRMGRGEEEYSSMSSLSSPDEKASNAQKVRNGAASVLTDASDHHHPTGSTVDDQSNHEEPVFDSSPPSLDKFLSFNSISSEIQAEISEFASLSALPQRVAAHQVATSQAGDQQVHWSEKSMVGPSFNNHEQTEPTVQNVEPVPMVSTSGASPTEAFWSPESADSYNFEEDVSKEIDEGILSELDTVGDFRVKEVNGEQNVESVPSELPALEVRTAEDIDLAFKQLHEGAELDEIILPSTIKLQQSAEDGKFRSPDAQPSTPLQVIDARFLEDIDFTVMQRASKGNRVTEEEVSMKELPVLEVRTAEDIDLAFKQLHEGVELEEVIVPSMIKQQSIEERFESPDAQPSTPLQVIEARFPEDIHVAFMQQAGPQTDEGISRKDLPVLEVRTAEDIDMAFKQLHEGAEIEEVILPSKIKQQSIEDEFGSPEAQPSTPLHVVEARFLEDIDFSVMQQALKAGSDEKISENELPLLEVRTAEDIDLAFKQLHEGVEIEEVILPSTIKDQLSAEDEFGSPREQPSTPMQVLQVRTAEDIDVAFKQLQEGAKLEEVILPSTIKQKSLEEDEFRSPREQPSTPLQVVEAKRIDEIHFAVLELASKGGSVPQQKISELELPVLEVRTAEDIDLAFKQLHEGAKLEDVILPSTIKQQPLEEDEFRSPRDQPSTLFQVVDAKRIDDIHLAKAAPDRNLPGSSENELPFLEVKTAEDIDLAFKQLHEGAEVNEVILPSTIKQRQPIEDEFGSPSEQPSTPLQVVDARFIEDIQVALLQQTTENNTDSRNVLPVLEVRTAEDIDLAFKQLHEGAEVNEVIVPSHIKQRSLAEEEEFFKSPDEQPSTPLQVVDARFVEDIKTAVMQHASSKGNPSASA